MLHARIARFDVITTVTLFGNLVLELNVAWVRWPKTLCQSKYTRGLTLPFQFQPTHGKAPEPEHRPAGRRRLPPLRRAPPVVRPHR